MSDLISKQVAIDAIKEKMFRNLAGGFYGTMQVLDELPSAERPMGKWINGYSTSGIYYKRCDQCFAVIDETFFAYDFDVNFCPNCGAYMGGKDNE